MKPIVLQDMEHASKVITQIASRAHQHVVGMFSPAILTFFAKPTAKDEKIGGFIAPINGVVTRVALHVEGNVDKKNPATITIETKGPGTKYAISINMTGESLVAAREIRFEAGMLISFYASVPEGSEVYASAVFTPDVGDYKVDRYLIDNLEANDEGIRDSIDKSPDSGPKN